MRLHSLENDPEYINLQIEMVRMQKWIIESMLIEDGCQIIKFWFSIDKEEQNKRLEERKSDPLISWKHSTVDMQAQMKWNDFTHYKMEMFKVTGTKKSLWIIMRGNHKDEARKEAMRYVLNSIPYDQKGLTSEGWNPTQRFTLLKIIRRSQGRKPKR